MKVLIADDHILFREGLRLVLENGGVTQVIEAGDFAWAVASASEPGLTIALIDLTMPGEIWEDGLRAVRAALPSNVPMVVLSASESPQVVYKAMSIGASGFISKSSPSKVMLSAIQLVLAGGIYLPPISMLDADAPTPSTDGGMLTPRQGEVMTLLREGRSNKEIARVLNLAEGTVKLHVTAILKALNVNNRTRAVVACERLGMTG